ncbi:MAG: hypothetical protein R3275_13665, partial [Saprospiraceae bacterium]|nr:hypothetical protein [Saprospiraceae bacterium]
GHLNMRSEALNSDPQNFQLNNSSETFLQNQRKDDEKESDVLNRGQDNLNSEKSNTDQKSGSQSNVPVAEETHEKVDNMAHVNTDIGSTESHLSRTTMSSTSPLKSGQFFELAGQEQIVSIPQLAMNNYRTKRWNFYISLLGGIHLTETKFTSGSAEIKDWIDHRSDITSHLETIQAGVRIGVASPWNFSFESGFSHLTQNEVFNTTFSHTEVNEEFIQLRPQGLAQDTILRSVNYLTERTTRRIRHYNQRRLLRVPFHLTYHTVYHGWIIGSAAGIGFNFPLATEGRTISFDRSELRQWTDNDEWKFRTDPYLTYHVRLSVGHYLTKDLIVSLEPTYNSTLRSIIISDSDLSARTHSFGVNLSLLRVF